MALSSPDQVSLEHQSEYSLLVQQWSAGSKQIKNEATDKLAIKITRRKRKTDAVLIIREAIICQKEIVFISEKEKSVPGQKKTRLAKE